MKHALCPALQLYEHVCDERQCTDIGCSDPDIPATVLLLPPEYELLDPAQLPGLVQLLNVGELRGSPVGGLTFGAEVPEYRGRGKRLSYPSGPTWQVRTAVLTSLHPGPAACCDCAFRGLPVLHSAAQNL